MPIDWEQLKPQMADLALEHICRRCKKLIPGAHYRIAGTDGNYHIECYSIKQEDNDAQAEER